MDPGPGTFCSSFDERIPGGIPGPHVLFCADSEPAGESQPESTGLYLEISGESVVGIMVWGSLDAMG